jgi:GNAT superfamily N-acetyltransferase
VPTRWQDGSLHRRATVSDLAAIQQIERAAGQAFRSIGMDRVADDEPVSAAVFAHFLSGGEAWVTVEPLDLAMHVEQVTVHPRSARQGIGAGLLDVAGERAATGEVNAVTLTTFRDVPWNAPYYHRLGFDPLPAEKWGAGLRHKVTMEAARGLDDWPRVVMRRPVN